MRSSTLIRRLRELLSQEDLTELAALHGTAPVDESAYDELFTRVRRDLPDLEARVARRREGIDRFHGLADAPEGRRQIMIRNAPPAMLAPLARDLMRRSYEHRFDAPQRSLELAEQALSCTRKVVDSGLLSSEEAADLEAEARTYLANGLRIAADVKAADRELERAGSLLRRGTGDRALQAFYVGMLGGCRFAQGRAEEAADLFERESRLRKLLGDRQGVGRALINRGVVAAWTERLPTACAYFERAMPYVEQPLDAVLALHALAERLARDGRGVDAWMVVCAAQFLAPVLDSSAMDRNLRWIKGLAYRALGDHARADRELAAVERELLEGSPSYRTGLLALDRAVVAAARGDHRSVRRHAETAWTVFSAQSLEQRALTALLVFCRAARAERVSEAMAMRVVNFMARYPVDRTVRLESKEMS